MAIDGPQLLAAIPATGIVINDGTVLSEAPRQILLRFSSAIDTATVTNASIKFIRSADDTFGNGNDIVITPGYIGVDNPNFPNEVVVRFNENLPDDNYRMIIVGAGGNALRDKEGDAFQDGVDLTRNFSLDLAPQVVAVVPQPISRDAQGKLTQASNTIEVYFNVNDPLDVASAQSTSNYQLIRTGNSGPTASTLDDTRVNPISVTYSAATGKAVLTFATGDLTQAGTYRLRVGTSEPLALGVTTLNPGTAGDSFASAAPLGNPFGSGIGTKTVALNDSIFSLPTTVTWPGSPLEPGEREFNSDTAHHGGVSNNGSIPLISYNFKGEYGIFQGVPQLNLITEAQKDRVREVFEYYSWYLGVQFVETVDSGWTIAVGDPRVLGATPNVGGVAGGSLAIMNSAVNWGASEPRGGFFNTSMHEIGHLLGLLHNYEAPAVMGGGIQDGVYPGDLDLIYGRFLWPALGNDINMYSFSLPTAGRLNVETIAERMQTIGGISSRFDSVITVYDSAGNIVARNDDYFGKDSLLQLDLAAGSYYVAITSTGNTNFDPRVAKSGAGGTTEGSYQLRMSFTPTTAPADGIRDTSGNRLDGDNDGLAGGVNNFWFKVDLAKTIYVDKASTGGTGTLGSITNPYTRINDALAIASQGSIVRIVGNGGADGNLATLTDNLSYNIGFDSIGGPLSDGTRMEIPRGVTVMVDAGAIIKLRAANINVGSVDPNSINRSEGALQILGTSARNAQGQDIGSVYITSYYDQSIGAAVPNSQGLAKGNWGGIVFREDADLEAHGVFLNYVNQARIRYGGGAVTVNGESSVYRPIHMESARPTATFNTVSDSADAALSATPNSFEESQFQGADYYADYTRVGPKIYGNTLQQNTLNGLYIAIETNSQTGRVLDELTVTGRIANTDIVHILTETLLINGQPGGPTGVAGNLIARPSGALIIDPGAVFKLAGGRFETELAGTLIAEGTINRPIVFTSLYDDRYGRSGSSDTSNNGNSVGPSAGDWGGFIFGPTSFGSIDSALVAFAGGDVRFEGFLSSMDPIEIHQAKVRVTNSTFHLNRLAGGNDRNGRGSSDAAVIYIRGAQPVIVNNVFEGNLGGSVISVNVNSLNSTLVDDWGRSRGAIGTVGYFPKNTGPLIRNNLIGDNSLNGMVVRGGLVTTNSIWDDTDIVHVVFNTINLGNQQSLTGTLRMQSSPSESLVVKVLGTNVDFVAGGELLDIDDRKGGSLQVVGQPGFPVVITSLKDDTVGAGLTPQGKPQKDTRNTKGVVPDPPANSTTTGPIVLDTTARDVHGRSSGGLDGWDTLRDELRYVYNNSTVANKPNSILVIGWEEPPTGYEEWGTPYSTYAIRWAAQSAGLQVTFADTAPEIASGVAGAVNGEYAAIFIPSHGDLPGVDGPGYPLPVGRDREHDNVKWWGGVHNIHLATLNDGGVKANLLNFLENKGGGLLAMALDSSEIKYNFLVGSPGTTGFILRAGGGNVMTPTAASIDGFNAADLSEGDLNIGTPFRTTFEGPTGFNRMVPWAVDPVTGEVAMLGRAAGGPVLGQPRDVVAPGDWGSIRLDVLSNDTNLEVINEIEQGFTSAGDVNQTPNTAQPIGELAKDKYSGNDNVRLGFEIYGGLSQATDSPGGADVDVYSFRGTAGTPVWFDLDRTASSLDSILELVDANGAVIARSDNSRAESTNPGLLVGSARPLQVGTTEASIFSNPDFYSSNEKDAGMRVVLPGTVGSVNNYYIRVRSGSANLNNLTAGITKGSYVLQIRLQETDQFPGSTIRYADVRYANNGIEIIGKPEESALVTNTVQTGTGNTSFLTAQNLGNLLESKGKTIDVQGNFTGASQVHWYKFELNFEQIQSIAGLNDGLRTFAAMMQVNFADGLGRPDTTLSVYDELGTLLMIARDGEIADSLARPNVGGIGSDSGNLAHGTYGTLDPSLGPIHLPAGAPKTYLPGGALNPASVVTYYVAVSTNAALPEALTASFGPTSSNTLVRLEPVESVKRIIDDRVGFGGGGITTSAGAPTALDPGQSSSRLFDGSLSAMNNYADNLHFGDVVLFANHIVNGSQRLVTINPFTGQVMTTGGLELPNSDPAQDQQFAFRNDGQLMGLRYGTTNQNSGNYVRINSASGTVVQLGDDDTQLSVVTSDSTPPEPWNLQTSQVPMQYTAMTFLQSPNSNERKLFAMAQRPISTGTFGGGLSQNILVELDPDTGVAKHILDDGTAWNATGPTVRSATNFVPIGILQVGITDSPADQMVGMAIAGGQMYTITADGRLFRVTDNWNVDEATDTAGLDFGYGMRQIQTRGLSITSLVAGPQNVEGGKYANMLFAIDTGGRMYAFDTDGNMRGVFLNGSSFLDTGLNNVEGMSFSTFDYNLWHVTTDRAFDLGHGINPSYHDNIMRTTQGTDSELLIGGASYYFGLSGIKTDQQPEPQQFGATAYSTNPDLENTYAIPGGTYGTLTSDRFSLEGYSPYDKPTLYFNYLLDTIDTNSNVEMTDAFRVYASTDGVNWSLLATNNYVPGSAASEHGQALTPSGGQYNGNLAKQSVQAMYDGTGWRQARVDLGDFAGKADIRLRFQFSTAGTMGSGQGLSGMGRVLKALPGNQLVHGDTFTVDGSAVFRFIKSGAPSGPAEILISDTDSSTVVAEKIAAAFDAVFSRHQVLTLDATGGSYHLRFAGSQANPITALQTAAIPANATAGQIQAALEALGVSGSGDVLRPGDVRVTQIKAGQFKIEFRGQYSGVLMQTLTTVNNLTGGVASIVVTQNSDDDLSTFSSAKVVGDELRLFDHTVTSSGPLAYFGGQLTGDSNGDFFDRSRDRSEVPFEGVYIDDFIIGFASRGEMVSGALPLSTEFGVVPKPVGSPEQILTGSYQLQIRPSQAFAAVDDDGDYFLLDTFDVNDRFTRGFTLTARSGASITDGERFAIDDGVQLLTFEFNRTDLNPGQTIPNSVLINIGATDSAAQVASKIATAINLAVTSRAFKVRARAANNGPRVDLFDALAVNRVGSGGLAITEGVLIWDSVGDPRPLFSSSTPGQTIVQNTRVANSFGVGIQVVPKMGQIGETGYAATAQGLIPIGVPGNTGAIGLLPSANTRGWVPGVTLKNNLVVDSGRTGIQVGGDPNANYSYSLGERRDPVYYRNDGLFGSTRRDVELFVPFTRVVNNTVHNARVGIAATNTSSPTIINNIVSGISEVPQIEWHGAGAAIFVDGSSGAPKDLPPGAVVKFGDTVVSANVYKNNRKNLVGTSETLAIALGANEALYVNEANGNFYLHPDSKAIDSSIDSLLDRAQLYNVVAPLGFAPSPILAPASDLLGQQRVDDPSKSPPAGVGGNAFKDRGALERADFLGPTAELINPIDNDASGNDRNNAPNQVTLLNALLTDFSIQLIDAGVGIDASTVLPENFRVTRTVNGSTVVLQHQIDYLLSYDTNSRIARLIPSQGIWVNGVYEITLVNTGDNPIADIAGNALQANAPPATRFIVNLTDTIASPWQNPDNAADVNADGRVNGSDLLLLINKILLDGQGPLPVQATAPPFLDPTGDGRLNTSDLLAVINYILNPPAAPLVAAAEDSSPEASPLAASPAATEGNAISVGLAASEQKSTAAAEPTAAPAVASSETPSNLHARSVDRVMYGELPAIAGVDAAEAWDADLEGILGDLDDELDARVSV